MWLFRGAQSAIFYYASCTPCAMSIDRHKRKKEAARTQRWKEKCNPEIITKQPRPFSQPTPFSTNEGWREEIALGPGPPTRRGGNRNQNTRRPSSWENQDQDQEQNSTSQAKERRYPVSGLWGAGYQREDEPLWGQEVRGSSIGFSGRGRADPNETSKYDAGRVPPVNDLHPPIVSGPSTRAETKWMLQPPPTAKVMAGKEPVRETPRISFEEFPSCESLDTFGRRPLVPNPSRDDDVCSRVSNEARDTLFDEVDIAERLRNRRSTTQIRDLSGSSDYSRFGGMPPDSWYNSISSVVHAENQGLKPRRQLPRPSEYADFSVTPDWALTPQLTPPKACLLQVSVEDDDCEDPRLDQLVERLRARWSSDF